MKTNDVITTYNYLTKLLDNNNKVYYSRFGDGDFYIMNGRSEKMHDYSIELCNELTEAFVINHPLYIRGAMINYPKEPGMRDGLFAPPKDQNMEHELHTNQGIPYDMIFESHIMFHYLSVFRQDLMLNFLNTYIRPKKKMFIGSVPKNDIEQLIGPIDYYVHVPSKNAYYTIDTWYPNILENIYDIDVCIPAAGMAGRIIQKRLWNLNMNIHSIDLGSVIDAACNISTRTWIDLVGYDRISNLLIK